MAMARPGCANRRVSLDREVRSASSAQEGGVAITSELPRPNPYLMWERLQRGWSHPEAADQLRQLMQAHGETQVGLDRNMWHRWETGARRPEPRYRKYGSSSVSVGRWWPGVSVSGEPGSVRWERL